MDLSIDERNEIFDLALSNNGILTYDIMRQHIINKGQGGFIDNDRNFVSITSLFNRLQTLRICCLGKYPESNITYAKVRSRELVDILNKLEDVDYRVYCAIEQAGNVGIWTADIRKFTGLLIHQVQKAIKILAEEKGLIKPVKDIHHKNRKLYMLSEIDPAVEIAGGSFYSNGDFDESLVGMLQEQISKFLMKFQGSTIEKITQYIKGLLCDKVSQEDIEKVVQILILENKAYSAMSSNNTLIYIWCGGSQLETLKYSYNVPCFSCPLLDQCEIDQFYRINPGDCTYINEWLTK